MWLKLFIVTLLAVTHTVSGQKKIQPKDSLEIKNQIEGFYSWYINLIKNRKLDDFSPGFVRRHDGMTTLDFTKYKDCLRKYQFTEAFIQRKINDYKVCVDNLNKIPFDKFSLFTDLDDFESINCDFGNRYEWIGGMEPKDKAELSGLSIMSKRTIIGHVDFISYGKLNGTATVIFKKFKKEWRVDDLRL